MDDHNTSSHPRSSELIERLVALARTQLGMQLSWMSLIDGDELVFARLSGDTDRFGVSVGDASPLEGSYCKHVLDGNLPNVVTDSSVHPIARDLRATTDMPVGAYAGFPVRAGDDVVGMLCCISDHSVEPISQSDLRLVDLVADLLGEIARADLSAARNRRAIEERINGAIERHDFEIVYQPIALTADGRVTGVEALARFGTGSARPDVWLDDAHSVGLGIDLEIALVEAALRGLDNIPVPLYVSVNLSAEAVRSERAEAAMASVDPRRVVIEVTEHHPVDDYAELLEALDRFRRLGARIAVDDVGAGFASFAHVLNLSPDLVKIDRSITRNIAHDASRRRLARAVVEVATGLGAGVVAEGVEAADDLDTLASIGVSSAQGYLLGRPAPLPAPSHVVAAKPTYSDAAREEESIAARRFELTLAHSPIGAAIVGVDGSFLHTNRALAELLGYGPERFASLTFQEITHPDDLDDDLGLLNECLDGLRTTYRIDKRYIAADGSIVWGDLSVVLVRDHGGSPLYFVSQIVDVTERHLREGQLRELASSERDLRQRQFEQAVVTDALTQLPNRAGAWLGLEELHRSGRNYGVLFCDIEGFGDINRQYGYSTGDRVLSKVAQRLGDATRRSDHVARWGGAEFIVVAEVANLGEMDELADRIRVSVSSAPIVRDLDVRCTLTVTSALRTPHDDRAESVIDRARSGDVRPSGTLGRRLWARSARLGDVIERLRGPHQNSTL